MTNHFRLEWEKNRYILVPHVSYQAQYKKVSNVHLSIKFDLHYKIQNFSENIKTFFKNLLINMYICIKTQKKENYSNEILIKCL